MTSLLLLALSAPFQETAPPKPSELIGTMFARYAQAHTLTGKVAFRQVATIGNDRAELTVTTDLNLERPGKLRIAQTSSRRKERPFVVTSDGKTFTYEAPRVTLVAEEPDHRLGQPVAEPMNASAVGRVIAMSRVTLPDAGSPFLSVASAWEPDLRNMQAQWVTLQDGGVGDVNGTPCRIVKGKWRPGAVQQTTNTPLAPTGVFGMWITPAGDLLKYSTEESIAVSDEKKKPLGNVTILSEWVGTLNIDAVIPEATFTVIK